MFYRTATRKLEQWRESPYRMPLIVRGARQVGKTTLINQFGKGFNNHLYINLDDDSRAREVLEMDIDLESKVRTLFAILGKPQNAGDTLIFIDEIQNSPRTIGLMRYFYEQLPSLHVVAAGSLLENLVDINVSFPVGRVQYLAVRPCSFHEFVIATGNGKQYDIMQEMPQLSRPFHDTMMTLFNQYVIVGGMPRAVQRYVEQHDVLAIKDVYSSLLTSYGDDVEKYVKHSKLKDVVRHILRYGWAMAAETITLGNFAASHFSSREVREAFNLLAKAMLAELVYPTTAATKPAIPELRRMPKLIWLDTGLVNYAAGIRQEVITARDVLDVWRGRIAEHVVAQELLTLNDDVNATRCYWMKGAGGGSAEVDFVYDSGASLIPIEVKAGHNSHLRSLHSYIDASSSDIAIRVWSQPYQIDDLVTIQGRKQFRLVSIPFYMVGMLPTILNKL